VGYGWLSDGPRQAIALPLTPFRIARALDPNPRKLPGEVLYADSIQGHGAQVFAVGLPDGAYRVSWLHPDFTSEEKSFQAERGTLRIPMPEGDWNISGILIKARGSGRTYPPPHAMKPARRPSIQHAPPSSVKAALPLTLELQCSPAPRAVRLHYRPVNQLVPWKEIEAAPGQKFSIPAADIQDRWDLMYYFEVVDDMQFGWFYPDPLVEKPYFVVTVNK